MLALLLPSAEALGVVVAAAAAPVCGVAFHGGGRRARRGRRRLGGGHSGLAYDLLAEEAAFLSHGAFREGSIRTLGVVRGIFSGAFFF